MTTPMQEQYNKIKEKYKDYILLFRLGDFYEAFHNDAEVLSRILGITLTGRGKNEDRIPMAGIPCHALNNYIPRILEHKLKIAIADQLEEPKPGKLVNREVTRIITPGTITDDKLIEDSKNNFIASILVENVSKQDKYHFSLAYSDITTGEVYEFVGDNLISLQKEILKVNPSEIIIEKSCYLMISNILENFFINQLDDEYVTLEEALQIIKSTFSVYDIRSLGLTEGNYLSIKSLATLLKYFNDVQKKNLEYIKFLKRYDYHKTMQLDYQTIKNLEIFDSQNKQISLYDVINKCQNPMGKRLLRKRIQRPFKDSEIIKHYHDSVEFFFDNMLLNCNIRDTLKNIIDLERIVSKLGLNTINPKEIYYLKLSLNKIFDVHKYIQDQQAIPTYLKTLLDKIQNKLPDVLKIVNKINEYLRDDPPTEVGFGYVIKTGVSKDLDNFIELKNNSKEYLLKIQQIEIEKTGIASLKIGFNQVFGYYLEVTKSNLNKVPPYYIRKQTLANVERFITPELKELEEKILSVDIQIKELEQKLFDNLCKFLLQYIDTVMYLADIISELDLITNFAFIAKENDYVKPIIHSRMNMIENGRHPVIEKLQKEYVPNNTNFTKPIHIITGPNMAGKSTYIRAVCLIYIMAQIGSFVPATKFVFTPVDNVFSRIGAADNLSKGESTFMVEMIETANILNNATRNSLIILDEIGRGTSTYDGVAIAWSIIEYICNNLQTKTLFATHYHELTNLEKKFSELVENYHVKVANLDNKNIKFLYKLDRGFTNKSYGIYVAKMAGIPELVIKRAEEILSLFEKNNNVSNVTKNDIVKDVIDIKPKKVDVEQLTLM